MSHRLNEATTSPTLCRLYLLGAFRLERAAQAIHLPTRKHESLLAYLVLHPEAHPREKIAALFWGDVSDEQARLSLRVALSTLRKELGDDILLTDRETVQFNLGFPLWVDARDLEQMANSEWQIADSHSEPSATSHLQSTISHYRGDLLPDFYDDWVAPERERLRALYLDALLQLVQHARSEGKYARALELAQRILATDRAHEKAHQHLMFCYAALGNRAAALKQYEECVRALRDELGVEPSAETTALCTRIQTEAAATKSPEAVFTNLPIPLTSFVGRQQEIAQVKMLIENARLLTLTGAGGCGKTRLAVQVVTELAAQDRFKHGVWWIDLAALSDPALVTQSVAMVFNLSESPGTPLIAVLTDYLRVKELLLVVDNCEHLLGACAQLIGTLLSACPKLQIVTTSREALNISGETVWRVPSLALPDTTRIPPLAQLRQFDAIQLFAERAVAVVANWRLAENAIPTMQICARLDGIPLAIELATARLRALSAEQITARLDDRFNLLTGGSRIAMPRHQTLRAAMDWSYDLLSDAERSLLRRLSVFAGGFTLEAVESVCVDTEIRRHGDTEKQTITLSPTDVLNLLTALVDKSLVVVEQKGKATRYRLLGTVQQYAHEKLIESGEAEPAQIRHRDYFVEWIEQAYPHLERADALEWKDRIECDYDNLRAAFEHAIDNNPRIALRIAWGLRLFWPWRGLVSEGRVWLERLVPKTEAWGQTATRARALNLAGFLATMHFDLPNAIRFCEEALTVAQAVKDTWEIGFAFERLGWTYGFLQLIMPGGRNASDCCAASLKAFQDLGDENMMAWSMSSLGLFLAKKDHENDLARGVPLMQQAMDKHRALGNQVGVAVTATNLGMDLTYAHDVHTAEPYAVESVKTCRELQHIQYLSTAVTVQSCAVLWKGEIRRAMACAEEALHLFRQAGNVSATVMMLEKIALCVGLLSKPEPAARILGAIEFQWETQRAWPMTIKGTYDEEWATIRAQLGDAAFQAARSAGRALSLDQVVEYAFENVKNV